MAAPGLVLASALLSLLPPSLAYCTWAGANPYWTGAPTVEQLTLTSVRVSWAGLLERADCADSMLVKHYKGDNTNDFSMSDPLSVTTNSYIVRDVVPLQSYTYQVIAREEKGLFGVDYDRSPKTKFTTRQSNTNIAKDDPLPVTAEEAGGDTETAGEEEEGQQPVYNPEAADTGSSLINPPASGTAIGGMKLEIFMGIVIGSLIVFIVAVGIVYNCCRRKTADKDIELEFNSDSEDDSSDEDEDDEEEAFERGGKEVKKYDMMIAASVKHVEPNAPELQHSLSSPP